MSEQSAGCRAAWERWREQETTTLANRPDRDGIAYWTEQAFAAGFEAALASLEGYLVHLEESIAQAERERDESRRRVDELTEQRNRFSHELARAKECTVDEFELGKQLEGARAENERLRELLGLIDMKSTPDWNCRETYIVRDACEVFGYGAVMSTAARLWREKDPIGALTVGPCVIQVKNALKKAP